jgi:hypothetical protein
MDLYPEVHARIQALEPILTPRPTLTPTTQPQPADGQDALARRRDGAAPGVQQGVRTLLALALALALPLPLALPLALALPLPLILALALALAPTPTPTPTRPSTCSLPSRAYY